jgi:ABC-type dipeptide/oligopeptide/nickel transport system ATPase component
VGQQLTDHVRHHLKLSRKDATAHAVALLERVRIPDAATALRKYPHQFSGGQRQRIAIAIALACEPDVLLADEPTTALDVTVQAGILRLLRELVDESGLAVLFVTHDLGVMSAIADTVSIMRAGRIVESGPRQRVFTAPEHEYTRQLLAALPGSTLEEAPHE